MITLKSDSLTFSFPEIDRELRQLLDRYMEATLATILTTGRQNAVSQLRAAWGFRRAGSAERAKAERTVLGATGERIAQALREACLSGSGLRGGLASVSLEFQRTLRIPDDGTIYPLPAGLGKFPLRHVDDFAKSVPKSWLQQGGVMMPMHQSEALWLAFDSSYPFAMKVGVGKINTVTGEAWAAGLQRHPQNYLVLPEQPWLDGIAVGKGLIRQFVAMPLGDGHSIEEQLTGQAEVGGLQVQVFPMTAEAYFRKEVVGTLPSRLEDILRYLVGRDIMSDGELRFGCCSPMRVSECDMGLGAGGRMRQEIYGDPHDFKDWASTTTSRCFIHLCNSLVWRQITGGNPPHPALTPKEYARSGIPWYDYYRDDLSALDGSRNLQGVKSVTESLAAKGLAPIPDNSTIEPALTVQYGNARRPDEVREWVEL